jgi:hypothetical protein
MWTWIGGAVVLLVAGALVPVFFAGNRSAAAGEAEIAARARYELLGHYVEIPAATSDPEAETLLRTGRERWDSAGAILATARSAADFELAGQVAGQGLTLVAAAHARIGLPGPP